MTKAAIKKLFRVNFRNESLRFYRDKKTTIEVMTAHELAKKLLEGEDLPVTITITRYENDHVDEIECVNVYEDKDFDGKRVHLS